MRVLIAGSRDFSGGYRIERALERARDHLKSSDLTVVTVKRRRGADRTAREIADEHGWDTEVVETVSASRADLCLAFLDNSLPKGTEDPGRITAMKAEKAGIKMWRYFG